MCFAWLVFPPPLAEPGQGVAPFLIGRLVLGVAADGIQQIWEFETRGREVPSPPTAHRCLADLVWIGFQKLFARVARPRARGLVVVMVVVIGGYNGWGVRAWHPFVHG